MKSPDSLEFIANEATENPEKEKDSTEVKIISWNAAFHTLDSGELERALHAFKDLGADIIFVQETGTVPDKEGKRNFRKMQEILGDDWVVDFSGWASSIRGAVSKDDRRKEEGGITVLINPARVKVKWINDIVLPLNDGGPSFIEKPWSIRGADYRQAQIVEAQVGDKMYLFVNLHLDWQGGETQKQKQLEYLGKYVSQRGGVDGIVIMGDTNIATEQGARNGAMYLSTSWSDKDVVRFQEQIPPSPTITQLGVINMKPDLAFVSDGVKVDEMATLPDKFGSDHNPISLKVSIKNN